MSLELLKKKYPKTAEIDWMFFEEWMATIGDD